MVSFVINNLDEEVLRSLPLSGDQHEMITSYLQCKMAGG